MARRVFKLEIDIETSFDRVRGFLLDLDTLAPLHPLIESIELLDSRAERPSLRSTHLEEYVEIGAPFGMGRFVAGQASKAHRETLMKMKQILQSEASLLQ